MKYTEEQLEQAFMKVQNKEHWKNPIKAIIPESEQEITREAISHFTATEAIFFYERHGFLQVEAKGYRLGPAGDY